MPFAARRMDERPGCQVRVFKDVKSRSRLPSSATPDPPEPFLHMPGQIDAGTLRADHVFTCKSGRDGGGDWGGAEGGG
jgi:hypothetical protein